MPIKEIIIQAAVALVSLIIILVALQRERILWGLVVLFATAYFGSIAGNIVVHEGWISYPVRLFPQYFAISIIYEYFAFPVINLLFWLTTKDSQGKGIFLQAVLYSGVITIVEIPIERYTDLLEYYTWNAYDSFASMAVFFMLIRLGTEWVERKLRDRAFR